MLTFLIVRPRPPSGTFYVRQHKLRRKQIRRGNAKKPARGHSLVANDLGETEEWLHEIAEDMDTEDGLIWVYSPENPDGMIAFSDDGVRSLLELVAVHPAAK